MKTTLLLLCLWVVGTLSVFAQNEESSTRKFIGKSEKTQINRDWNEIAEFKSGIGESLKFIPIEVIDLNTNEKVKSLQVEMDLKRSSVASFSNMMKTPEIHVQGWVGIDEVQDLIAFLETYVVPNIKTKLKKKSIEYIFRTKEMKMIFIVKESTRYFQIVLNDYDHNGDFRYTFWTKTQVDRIPKLVEVLKNLINS